MPPSGFSKNKSQMSLLPSLKFFKISKRAFFLTVEDGVPQPKVQVELRYN